MDTDVSFIWLEITGQCQLQCVHCYADSGPGGGHGLMSRDDWFSVMTQAAEIGVRTVQLIGGEPTLHPDLPELVVGAFDRSLRVEVFSNLVHVTPRLWEVFARPGVSLATSYYSDEADQHDRVTARKGSHARTRANIAEATRRSIPLRAGVIHVSDGQRVGAARDELIANGLAHVQVDRLRQVGRGVRNQRPSTAELCGSCAHGVVAVSPTGEVWPCVFARWMPLGNLRTSSPADVLRGDRMDRARRDLAVLRSGDDDDEGEDKGGCDPRCCPNNMCDPQCSPSCSPSCRPAGNCRPSGNCAPNY